MSLEHLKEILREAAIMANPGDMFRCPVARAFTLYIPISGLDIAMSAMRTVHPVGLAFADGFLRGFDRPQLSVTHCQNDQGWELGRECRVIANDRGFPAPFDKNPASVSEQ